MQSFMPIKVMFKLKKKTLYVDLTKNLLFIMMSSYMYGHVIQSSSLSKLQKFNTLFFVCGNF